MRERFAGILNLKGALLIHGQKVLVREFTHSIEHQQLLLLSRVLLNECEPSLHCHEVLQLLHKVPATVLQFEYYATTKKGVETQFCELGELTYVAESYFRSAIKLLSEVEKIDITKDDKYNYNLSFYFFFHIDGVKIRSIGNISSLPRSIANVRRSVAASL